MALCLGGGALHVHTSGEMSNGPFCTATLDAHCLSCLLRWWLQLTRCLSRHFALFRYFRQNSQRNMTGSLVRSTGYGEKYHGRIRYIPNSTICTFFMRVTTSSLWCERAPLVCRILPDWEGVELGTVGGAGLGA